MDRVQLSRLRQQIVQTERARGEAVERLLRVGPMIQGSFVNFVRRCGKPRCHCATGAPHVSKCLSRSKAGKTRTIHVPAASEVEVAHKAAQYRQWRRARATLMKLAAQTAALADALQQALTEPYPAGDRQDTSPRRTAGAARR
jgi:hypothetical protein